LKSEQASEQKQACLRKAFLSPKSPKKRNASTHDLSIKSCFLIVSSVIILEVLADKNFLLPGWFSVLENSGK